jgi:macrophage erythroblast attacher
MLRLQQYIELIRTQSQPKLVEAIAHAKKYIIPYWNTYKEAQQACGLLAIPPDNLYGIYGDLYKDSRWSELAELFTTTHNSLLSLPSVPLLHVALSSGLSALKTPACHSSHAEDAFSDTGSSSTLGHGVCPICSTELNDLARNVPYAHHTKSHVEHDLFLLPNGRVYGKERLDDYARKSGLSSDIPEGGEVKDPVTGQTYPRSLLKKVFIT